MPAGAGEAEERAGAGGAELRGAAAEHRRAPPPGLRAPRAEAISRPNRCFSVSFRAAAWPGSAVTC